MEARMRCWRATSGGGYEGLRLLDEREPVPGPRQILIQVRACSLNFRELSVLRGTYPLPVKPDVVMGADGAGEVIAVGAETTRVRVGDRVCVAMFPRWIDGPIAWEYAPQVGGTLDGMLTERTVVDEQAVVSIPAHLSYEEAATLPGAAVTAWNALMGGGRPIIPGDTVLVQGTGGVSLFALQMARLAGARVIATTSNDAKRTRLRELGASEVLNYRLEPDYWKSVRRITNTRGVDSIVDVAGGSMEASLRSIGLGGTIAFVGRLAGATDAVDSNLLYTSVATVRVIFAGSRGHFVAMNRAIEASGLRPVIDRVFPFADVADALRYLESGAAFGKVVVTVP